jgi:hypothetical protein
MRIRLISRRTAVVFAWLLSLLGAGAAGTVWAQRTAQPEPQVLSGSDVGFRLERVGRDGAGIGTLVIRLDGRWVEAQFSSRIHPVK